LTIIKLENISKTYESNTGSTKVLTNISFELKKGETRAIMGASGSGKSTLMNIIGLLDKPTDGQYQFLNEDVSFLSLKQLADKRNQHIGFVFQFFYLLPRLTAVQNIMLPLFYRGISKAIAYQEAMTILEKLNLASVALQRPAQLSGGQQQRIAIARALIGRPDIILADEPTGALDKETGKDIMKLFIELNQTIGATILIITHDETVARLCQQINRIEAGRLF